MGPEIKLNFFPLYYVLIYVQGREFFMVIILSLFQFDYFSYLDDPGKTHLTLLMKAAIKIKKIKANTIDASLAWLTPINFKFI